MANDCCGCCDCACPNRERAERAERHILELREGGRLLGQDLMAVVARAERAERERDEFVKRERAAWKRGDEYAEGVRLQRERAEAALARVAALERVAEAARLVLRWPAPPHGGLDSDMKFLIVALAALDAAKERNP